jgi:2-dehydro-3-deoxy-D-arabinonate dehydratase
MRYVRVDTGDGYHLLATDEGTSYDLTTDTDGDVRTIGDLCDRAADGATSLDDVTREVCTTPTDDYELPEDAVVPIERGEVWEAGGTYDHSTEMRAAASSAPAVYESLLGADRPELLLKATPARTVGYDDAVGIRTDSERNGPEAALAAVCYDGAVVGYTIGIGIRSRSIEAENPLYTQQACTFDRCCALGPAIVSADSVDDPQSLDVSMAVHSSGARVYGDTGTTGDLRRSPADLVATLDSHQGLPDPTVVLTGGAVVPSADFTLTSGDEITVEIESLGTLWVSVTEV